MSSTKKTIQINPELFKVSGNKTRKSKEKKELTLNPIIAPNTLKNKLLNRIKEHKMNETKINLRDKNNSANSPKSKINPNISSETSKLNTSSNDEFYGALNYLSELTKNKKREHEKQRIMHKKTLKANIPYQLQQPTPEPSISQYQTQHQSQNQIPNVLLDLPQELQQDFIPQTSEVFNVNYKVEDDVPYGCLKNGRKKTYREWKEINREIQLPDMVRPPTPPKKNPNSIFLDGATPIEQPELKKELSRNERLEQIKTKLRKIQDQEKH